MKPAFVFMWHWLRLHTPARLKIWFRRIRARSIDPFDRGVDIILSGSRVRAPAYFSGGGRRDYETASVARLIRWLAQHPDGLLVDVGCSLSIYGIIALSKSRHSEVIAIDADAAGLKCSRFLCSKVDAPERLKLVHGFVARDGSNRASLGEACENTCRTLADPAIPAEVEAIRYYERSSGLAVPQFSLDGLLEQVTPHRAVLIKIDVEGAELDVLAGAVNTIRRLAPILLLSVHPQFGVDVSKARAFLASLGYSVDHFETDHEEHWCCMPARRGNS